MILSGYSNARRVGRVASICSVIGVLTFLALLASAPSIRIDSQRTVWTLLLIASTAVLVCGYRLVPTERRAKNLLACAVLTAMLLFWLQASGTLAANATAYIMGFCVVTLLIARISRNPS